MTMYTLTMAIGFLLGAALLSASVILGCLLVWTARRIGDATQFAGELDTLRTEIKNLDDFLESYRKRDAQRDSTAAKNAKKANGAAPPEEPQKEIPDEIARLFS